ncbi:MAG: TIR domain-containing protein [Chloroflexi bacterium]|nr:TIR domain-containing protein [Chloroflexota bacterium]
MRENENFYHIFFIYHPADIDKVRRVAAQTAATGVHCYFSEDEFGRSAESIGRLQDGINRSYTVAFALSPESAESQLCNELLQFAIGNGKRLVTLILDEDIDVEVHAAIAQNPYVFFRESDELAARVDELRAYLPADDNLQLHTELLVLAKIWRERGRPPDLLLPPSRLEEARQWLAGASARHPKPSPLQVEFVHTSRRQPPKRRPLVTRQLAVGLAILIALGIGFLLLQRALAGFGAAQFSGALTNEARTQAAMSAETKAGGDGALGLIDEIGATSVSLRAAAAHTATAESIAATAVAQATQTAQAQVDQRATQMRATEIVELERDEVAKRLVQAGAEALAQGDADLALALAWEAKDGLEDPKLAHRLLRRATGSRQAKTLDDVALLRLHPAGAGFALLPLSRDRLQLHDGESWSLRHELSDHEASITTIAYSPDGAYLVSASEDGEIIIRDGESGGARRSLRRHQGAVTALAFTAAGGQLYSGGQEPLLLAWDIASGESLASYTLDEGDEMTIHELIVTGDGGRVIGWSSSGMRQWSADALELLAADDEGRVYRGYDAQRRIGYTGGRSLPAFPGDRNTGALTFWDLESSQPLIRLTDGFNWSFLNVGDLSAAADDLQFIAFHEEVALVVVDNSDDERRALIVSVDEGRVLRNFDGDFLAQLRSAEFLDADMLISGTRDGRVILWSASDGGFVREIASAPGGIESLLVNEAANLAVARSIDGAAHLWRIHDSAADPMLTLRDALPGTAIDPSGAALLLVDADGLSLREVESGSVIARISASLVSSVDDRFAAYREGRLTVYETKSGAEIHSWDWAGGAVVQLQLSPAGDRVATVTENSELWLARADANSLRRLARLAARPSLMRFAPDGRTLLTLQDQHAVLWDTESGGARAAYPLGTAHSAPVQAAFTRDSDSIVFYLQMEEGLAALAALELTDNTVRQRTFVDVQTAALSADGERLSLAFRDGRVHIVETASGEVLRQLPAGAHDLSKLRYLPEADALLAAAGAELLLWDLAAAVIEQRFAHGVPIADFGISRDETRILSADESGTYRLWQVESAEDLLERIARFYAPRDLTCAEREQHLVAPLCE